jgi:hypothetical protein
VLGKAFVVRKRVLKKWGTRFPCEAHRHSDVEMHGNWGEANNNSGGPWICN